MHHPMAILIVNQHFMKESQCQWGNAGGKHRILGNRDRKIPSAFFCENEILYLLLCWMSGSGWRLISPVSKILLWASVGCWRKTCTIWSAFSSAAMIVFNFVHLKSKKIFPALTFTVILCLPLNRSANHSLQICRPPHWLLPLITEQFNN